MAQYEMIGDKEDLSKKGIDSPTDHARDGAMQLVGDQESMARRAIPSPTDHASMGTIQRVGEEVSLNRKPVFGWGSTPQAGLQMAPVEVEHRTTGKGKKK